MWKIVPVTCGAERASQTPETLPEEHRGCAPPLKEHQFIPPDQDLPVTRDTPEREKTQNKSLSPKCYNHSNSLGHNSISLL